MLCCTNILTGPLLDEGISLFGKSWCKLQRDTGNIKMVSPKHEGAHNESVVGVVGVLQCCDSLTQEQGMEESGTSRSLTGSPGLC
jgi:hypothetical protein